MIRHSFVVLLCFMWLAGCGESHRELKQAANHLRPLAVLYGKYLANHRGQPLPMKKRFVSLFNRCRLANWLVLM